MEFLGIHWTVGKLFNLGVVLFLVGGWLWRKVQAPKRPPGTIKYDAVDWHMNNAIEPLTEIQAAAHIGYYLTWLIDRKLVSREVTDDKVLMRTVKQQTTATKAFLSQLDGKFFSDLLTREGNAFTWDYYHSNRYLDDFFDTLLAENDGDNFYVVADSWANYRKLKPVLDRRFEAWQRKRQRKAA